MIGSVFYQPKTNSDATMITLILVKFLILTAVQTSLADSESQCIFGENKMLCNDSNLVEIPNKFLVIMEPQDIVHLDLSNNYIETLTNTSLSSFENLQELILRNSSVRNVEAGAFDNLKQLKTLDLSGNFIKHFPSELLEACTNLENLSLENNLIENLDDFNTSNLINLKHLDVSNNMLTYLPEHLMEHLFLLNDFTLEITNNPWNCNEMKWAKYLEAQNLTDVLCSIEYTAVFRMGPFLYKKSDQENRLQKSDMKLVLWILLSVLAGAVAGNADRIYKAFASHANKHVRRRNASEKREEEFTLKVNS